MCFNIKIKRFTKNRIDFGFREIRVMIRDKSNNLLKNSICPGAKAIRKIFLAHAVTKKIVNSELTDVFFNSLPGK